MDQPRVVGATALREGGRGRIAIVGGGIAGLSTAWFLERAMQKSDLPVECRLFEASEATGGVVRTLTKDGFVLDLGPDSLFKAKPAAADLARSLGLGDQIVEARSQELATLIWARGRLHPLPDGLELVAPSKILPLLTTGLLSTPGKLRMLLEPFVRARRDGADESIAGFVRRRLGNEAARRIAGPLMAGIHAGDPERLSLRSTFPRLADLESRHGSLTIALRRMRAQCAGGGSAHGNRTVRESVVAEGAERSSLDARPGDVGAPRSGGESRGKAVGTPASLRTVAGPPFVTLLGGLQMLTDRLTSSLQRVEVARGTAAAAVEPHDAGWRVRFAAGEPWEADACVLAVPARPAADLVRGFDPDLAGLLASVRYVSTATVFLGYGKDDRPALPPSTGFLVPREEGRAFFGCTFVTNKFPGRAPAGSVLVRAFVGGAGDEERLESSDEHLVAAVRRDLEAMIGLRSRPILVHVQRWPKANPQYEVGHAALVESVDRRLDRHPGLFITGSALRGVGVPDGVELGRQASELALARLRADGSQVRD